MGILVRRLNSAGETTIGSLMAATCASLVGTGGGSASEGYTKVAGSYATIPFTLSFLIRVSQPYCPLFECVTSRVGPILSISAETASTGMARSASLRPIGGPPGDPPYRHKRVTDSGARDNCTPGKNVGAPGGTQRPYRKVFQPQSLPVVTAPNE